MFKMDMRTFCSIVLLQNYYRIATFLNWTYCYITGFFMQMFESYKTNLTRYLLRTDELTDLHYRKFLLLIEAILKWIGVLLFLCFYCNSRRTNISNAGHKKTSKAINKYFRFNKSLNGFLVRWMFYQIFKYSDKVMLAAS